MAFALNVCATDSQVKDRKAYRSTRGRLGLSEYMDDLSKRRSVTTSTVFRMRIGWPATLTKTMSPIIDSWRVRKVVS